MVPIKAGATLLLLWAAFAKTTADADGTAPRAQREVTTRDTTVHAVFRDVRDSAYALAARAFALDTSAALQRSGVYFRRAYVAQVIPTGVVAAGVSLEADAPAQEVSALRDTMELRTHLNVPGCGGECPPIEGWGPTRIPSAIRHGLCEMGKDLCRAQRAFAVGLNSTDFGFIRIDSVDASLHLPSTPVFLGLSSGLDTAVFVGAFVLSGIASGRATIKVNAVQGLQSCATSFAIPSRPYTADSLTAVIAARTELMVDHDTLKLRVSPDSLHWNVVVHLQPFGVALAAPENVQSWSRCSTGQALVQLASMFVTPQSVLVHHTFRGKSVVVHAGSVLIKLDEHDSPLHVRFETTKLAIGMVTDGSPSGAAGEMR